MVTHKYLWFLIHRMIGFIFENNRIGNSFYCYLNGVLFCEDKKKEHNKASLAVLK